MNRINISKPFMGEEEIEAVRNVLLSGNLVQGVKVKEFEEAVSGFLGIKHAIATSSGTTALHLAIESLGIKPGDEVITTPFTFIASSNCILYNGAKPVFVDIDPKTFNIDPEKIEEKITDKTKAVLVVHLYGQPCEMDKIMGVCKKHNLKLIEDSAQAIGAEYKGQKIGTFGDVSALSFYATKNITTGEGGMLLTNNDVWADKTRIRRQHGQRMIYEYEILGYNYRMTDIQAAIGIEQMKKIEDLNNKRIENAKTLAELLSGIDGIVLPSVAPETKHVFHQYTIHVLDGKRDALKEQLNEKGIQSMIYYPQTIYQPGSESCPEAERACKEVLSLPIHPHLKKEDIERIAEEVKNYLEN
ncbi:MAG: DegT/DnrJ/EryC1/StrS family aminotransferase [Nanoarchaeota archaeon]|nr:DegT/DnrJ/EryC1/StrS family aminotransferase [Nanoarchaeota archaeon]MBU2519945.1 DegT/DnrJ/EryC1/StrS family aminotransferase [Nanoarchaeota archaeon]